MRKKHLRYWLEIESGLREEGDDYAAEIEVLTNLDHATVTACVRWTGEHGEDDNSEFDVMLHELRPAAQLDIVLGHFGLLDHELRLARINDATDAEWNDDTFLSLGELEGARDEAKEWVFACQEQYPNLKVKKPKKRRRKMN